MTRRSPGFRMLCTATAGFLLLSAAPLRAQQDANTPAADPPARVGRIARISGTVSFHPNGASDWAPAQLNLPVTSGAGIWTEPGSNAAVEIGGGRIVLDAATQLEIPTLDDHVLIADDNQGSIFLRLRQLPPGDAVTLRTPRGTVAITAPGAYVVNAGDSETPTQVTVVEGGAQVSGPGLAQAIAPHQTATITGSSEFTSVLGPQVLPGFAAAALTPPHPVAQSAPPVVSQMTGGEALMQTGSWAQTPDYGAVWYPPVDAGWVPYRQGHWAYIQPWGWTWVDDAPWGFAPFHYGRWARIGPRWGWIPVLPGVAVYERPVYAPALVAFVGFGVGVGLALADPVGWVPLGPREVYRPPYRVSNTYIRNVNIINVTNFNAAEAARAPNAYMNRNAATVVSGATMANSQPVARAFRGGSGVNFAAAHPLATPSVAPTRSTAGVTPALAQHMNLQGGAPRPAPGPAVHAAAPALVPHTARPAAATGLPPLRPAPAPGQAPARPPVPGATFAPTQARPAPLAQPSPRPTPTPSQAPSRPAPTLARPATPNVITPTPVRPQTPQAPRVETPSRPVQQRPIEAPQFRAQETPQPRFEPRAAPPAAAPRQAPEPARTHSCPPNRPNC